MKYVLFALLLFINSTCLLSQPKLKRDSAYIQPRSFNTNALKELKGQSDFQYNKYKEPPESLWQKFWNWFWWKINRLLSTARGRVTFWSILSILGAAIIIFFVIKITGMDQGGLFGRSNKGILQYTVSGQDIHQISFEDEIEHAINNGNYRLAARLQYLQALKKLSDSSYIDWQINKTNTDYLKETAGKPFYKMFNGLTVKFEHIWYGEEQLSKQEFIDLRQQFQQFYSEVNERI